MVRTRQLATTPEPTFLYHMHLKLQKKARMAEEQGDSENIGSFGAGFADWLESLQFNFFRKAHCKILIVKFCMFFYLMEKLHRKNVTSEVKSGETLKQQQQFVLLSCKLNGDCWLPLTISREFGVTFAKQQQSIHCKYVCVWREKSREKGRTFYKQMARIEQETRQSQSVTKVEAPWVQRQRPLCQTHNRYSMDIFLYKNLSMFFKVLIGVSEHKGI